ncbi:MAG: apolipoprotein N-acyltransferase [Myxococcota bacterium]
MRIDRELGLRILAAVVGAVILSVLAPPLNLHWLHWIAYLPMFWALRAETPRQNRWLSFLYGTVGVAVLFRWLVDTITVFSPIPWLGAVGILVLFSAVFGLQYLALWPMVHPLRQRLGPWWVAVFPALEVVLEWIAMKVFLFPYNHGVSQYRVPWTWQIVSVTGVWGLSYLVFLVNAALAEVMYRLRESKPVSPLDRSGLVAWRPFGGAAAAVAATVAFGIWRSHHVREAIDASPVMRVAQLQSDKDMVYRGTHSARSAFEDWLAATRTVAPGAADLVVWPEGACPYDLNDDAYPGRRNIAREVLSSEAKRGGFELAVGGGTRVRAPDSAMGESRVNVFNSVYFFGSDGQVEGHYDKLVPLPFGEYMPFGEYLPEKLEWLPRKVGIGDFRKGAAPVLFDGTKARIATPICYEAILPGTCRLFRDADLLVVVTNDAWFGNTANPYQHAMLAATRATELGIPMVRAAYTGVSFVVEPDGRITSETTPFTAVNRIAEVHLAKFDTLYARFGDWFVGVCAIGVLVPGLAMLATALDPLHAPAPRAPHETLEPHPGAGVESKLQKHGDRDAAEPREPP